MSTFQPNEFVIQFDGDDVHPNTVDAAAVLEASALLLLLVRNVADEDGIRVDFTGVRIVDKCAALAAVTTHPGALAAYAPSLHSILAGRASAPPNSAVLVRRLRGVLRQLPEHYACRVGVGPVHRFSVSAPAQPTHEVVRSIETLRVELVRIGGRSDTVRCVDVLTHESLELDCSVAQMKELGGQIREEIEVEIESMRDGNEKLKRGKLLDWHMIPQGSNVGAWRSWFTGIESDWEDVDDVELAVRGEA